VQCTETLATRRFISIMQSRDTPQKCHFTLGFCMLKFSIVGCPRAGNRSPFISQLLPDILRGTTIEPLDKQPVFVFQTDPHHNHWLLLKAQVSSNLLLFICTTL
jgi:hypothetical protein